MALSDKQSKAPSLQNAGPMCLMNPHDHRCCQHNVAHGLPYYAEHVWLATPDNGLAAVLYAPCGVSAQVGSGTTVRVEEVTHYPFDEHIDFELSASEPVEFPLYLRVPKWCDNPVLTINSVTQSFSAWPQSYIRVEREWETTAAVRLTLPMSISLTTWASNHNCVSVNRGPLTYSLKIEETYTRDGGTDTWPAWEIAPAAPWNYGLVLDETNPPSSFTVVNKAWPASDNPFDTNSAPIELRVTARRIPQWTLDIRGVVQNLQQSPAASSQTNETVSLVPMGGARLRISAFPVIGAGTNAHKWIVPATPSASHCWPWDSVDAMNDGLEPANSCDHSIPRMTWWDHKGSAEWVQYDYSDTQLFNYTEVYWFDDQPIGGGCRVPESWSLVHKQGASWTPAVAHGPYGVAKDQYNVVDFDAAASTAYRLEVQLQSGYSSGILEWRMGIPEPGATVGLALAGWALPRVWRYL